MFDEEVSCLVTDTFESLLWFKFAT